MTKKEEEAAWNSPKMISFDDVCFLAGRQSSAVQFLYIQKQPEGAELNVPAPC